MNGLFNGPEIISTSVVKVHHLKMFLSQNLEHQKTNMKDKGLNYPFQKSPDFNIFFTYAVTPEVKPITFLSTN